MVSSLALFVPFFLLASTVFASNSPKCGQGSKCPSDLPCCSQYGECGVGAYCLGGCDPIYSNALDSCTPAPVCKSQDYKLNSLNDITPNTKYLGNASEANWVSSGQPITYQNNVLLTMAEGTVGTLLASTSYVWYGKISATMKSSRGQGVVSAFILLSDVKDEIDFEFIGADLSTAQSNFYSLGVTNYTNERNISVTDTFQNWHTYEIDWNPDSIKWSVDGKSYRTLNRADTWNASSNMYDYPQTPARVQLSLWPAGLSTNGKGTVDWAGGLVDWHSADIQNAGYYYAQVSDVNVQCFDPPSGASKTGSKAYKYINNSGTNSSVQITDDDTTLGCFYASGQNRTGACPSTSSGNSNNNNNNTSSTPTPAATVPGLDGIGTGSNGLRGDNSTSPSSSANAGSGSGSGSGGSASSPTSSSVGGFSQGGSPSGSSAAPPGTGEKVLQGSLFAVLVAVGALLIM